MVLTPPSHRTNSAGAEPDISVAKLDDDLYSLLSPTETVGFVHRVGSVYVALRGAHFSHAVEVGQSLSWDRAIELVKAG
jgi:hypothetical protein